MSLAGLTEQAMSVISQKTAERKREENQSSRLSQNILRLEQVNNKIHSLVRRKPDKNEDRITYWHHYPSYDMARQYELGCAVRSVSHKITVDNDSVNAKIILGIPREGLEWRDNEEIISYVGIQYPEADMVTHFFLEKNRIVTLNNVGTVVSEPTVTVLDDQDNGAFLKTIDLFNECLRQF